MKAVVMGGSSGIGLATAELLAGRGFEVIVTGRDAEKLTNAAKGSIRTERLDGTDVEAVEAFFTGFGDFEHLILAFSPGAVGAGAVKGIDLAAMRTAFEGKLFAYFAAISSASVTGSITMISAASARAAFPETSVLAAVNGAVERMVSPLAAELAPVRVNAVSPGTIDTPWWSFLPEEQRREQFAGLAAAVPAGRIGDPEDVAAAVGYLVEASFVTGSVLPVDGGMTVA